MLEGLPELASEVRAFREEGLPLSFTVSSAVAMAFALFAGLFLALVLANAVNKRL